MRGTESRFIFLFNYTPSIQPLKPFPVTFVIDKSFYAIWISHEEALQICGAQDGKGAAKLPQSVSCFLPEEMRDKLYYNVLEMGNLLLKETPNDANKIMALLWEQIVIEHLHFGEKSSRIDAFIAEQQQLYLTRMEAFIEEQQQLYVNQMQMYAKLRVAKLADRL